MGRRGRFEPQGEFESYVFDSSGTHDGDLARAYETARGRFSSNPSIDIRNGKAILNGEHRYLGIDLDYSVSEGTIPVHVKDGSLEYFVCEDVMITFIIKDRKVVSCSIASSDSKAIEREKLALGL